jgi:predicted short-subunit dehydrogenase-like oxidoreductase (DUF2520 family)
VTIIVAGRGRLGRGLARALESGNVETRLVSGRSLGRLTLARGDVVVLAVPDPAIRGAAEALAPRVGGGVVVLHTAGARGVGELDACTRAGAPSGVMHPLASFPTRRAEPVLAGTTFVIAGAPRAVSAAKRIARTVGARTLVANVHGARYHAAAALAANGAAALASTSVRILEGLGIDRRAAARAVGALLRTVAVNVERVGVPDALTGPVARGDAATVAAHRRALGRDRDALAAYDAIAPTILRVAREAGLDEALAEDVRRALRSGAGAKPETPEGHRR